MYALWSLITMQLFFVGVYVGGLQGGYRRRENAVVSRMHVDKVQGGFYFAISSSLSAPSEDVKAILKPPPTLMARVTGFTQMSVSTYDVQTTY